MSGGGGGWHREVIRVDNCNVAELENYATMSLKNLIGNSTIRSELGIRKSS